MLFHIYLSTLFYGSLRDANLNGRCRKLCPYEKGRLIASARSAASAEGKPGHAKRVPDYASSGSPLNARTKRAQLGQYIWHHNPIAGRIAVRHNKQKQRSPRNIARTTEAPRRKQKRSANMHHCDIQRRSGNTPTVPVDVGSVRASFRVFLPSPSRYNPPSDLASRGRSLFFEEWVHCICAFCFFSFPVKEQMQKM